MYLYLLQVNKNPGDSPGRQDTTSTYYRTLDVQGWTGQDAPKLDAGWDTATLPLDAARWIGQWLPDRRKDACIPVVDGE